MAVPHAPLCLCDWIFLCDLKFFFKFRFDTERICPHPLSPYAQVAAEVPIIKADQAALNRVRLGENTMTPITNISSEVNNQWTFYNWDMPTTHGCVSVPRRRPAWPNRIDFICELHCAPFILLCHSHHLLTTKQKFHCLFLIERKEMFAIVKNINGLHLYRWIV